MDQQSPFKPTPQTPHYVPHNGEQTPAPLGTPAAQTPLQSPVYGEQPGAPQAHEYAFIMNAEKPKAHAVSLPGNSSTAIKALYAVGALLAVIILLSVAKNLFSGSGNVTQFVSVAQDQQELIHLSTAAAEQTTLSAGTQNFIYTTQLGVTSQQSQIVTYLAKSGHKLTKQQLTLKISPQADTQLTNAAAVNNYESVFKAVMKTKLETYQSDLNAAYSVTDGPNGKTLLKNQYTQAGLLIKQLGTN